MSGRKNVLLPKQILPSGLPTDMSSDIDSIALYCQFQDNIGLQVEWSGAPSGVITVEASVNWDDQKQTGTFYPLTFNPALEQPAGTSGGYLISLNQLPFVYYRVSYDAISGTGLLNVYATSKEI